MECTLISKDEIARLIDHTLLKPHATKDEVARLCQEAIDNRFWSVCVNPSYVSIASHFVKNKMINVCSVVGFPFGANTVEVKSHEAKKAIQDGANEIDMVINLGALKSGNYEIVKHEIESVVEQGKRQGDIIIKVIIETGLLSETEKVLVCRLVRETEANFVKTSTGFNASGATVHDVKLLRNIVGPDFGVKASGGIRTYNDAVKMIEAGANRIGTSSSIAIMENCK